MFSLLFMYNLIDLILCKYNIVASLLSERHNKTNSLANEVKA